MTFNAICLLFFFSIVTYSENNYKKKIKPVSHLISTVYNMGQATYINSRPHKKKKIKQHIQYIQF